MNKYKKENYQKIKYKIRSILKHESQIPIPYENYIDIKKVTPFITKEILDSRSRRVWEFIFKKNIQLIS